MTLIEGISISTDRATGISLHNIPAGKAPKLWFGWLRFGTDTTVEKQENTTYIPSKLRSCGV